jgi:hypothetical protein
VGSRRALDEFNGNSIGCIVLVDASFGPRFRGLVPERCLLEGRDDVAQVVLLATPLRGDRARF